MSRRILMCGTFALAGGIALGAQTGQPPAPRAETPAAGVVASVTLTGCLEPFVAESAASPSDESAAQTPAGVKFMLTQANGQATPAPAAGGGGGATAERDQKYLLLSSPTLALAPHVNHTVKVVGTITPQPAPGATAEDKLADPSRAETNLPAGPRPEAYRLNLVEVSTITMVAKTCGGK